MLRLFINTIYIPHITSWFFVYFYSIPPTSSWFSDDFMFVLLHVDFICHLQSNFSKCRVRTEYCYYYYELNIVQEIETMVRDLKLETFDIEIDSR